MTGFSQLTIGERYQIYALHAQGMSLPMMANAVKRSPSTISRELSRNKGDETYHPSHAQSLCDQRKRTARKATKVTPSLMKAVGKALELG